MKRPTEFIPIYDQSPKQAAEMVEKLFVEIERLTGENKELRDAVAFPPSAEKLIDKLTGSVVGLKVRLERVRVLVRKADDEQFLVKCGPGDKYLSVHRENYAAIYAELGSGEGSE